MSLFEARKILRVGAKSYAVSIPKKWASVLGLKPGDTVDVILDKNGLIIIRPRKIVSNITSANIATINASELSREELFKAIEGSYIEGYDVIKIAGLDEPEIIAAELATKITTRLPGTVVLEEDGGILIKVALSEEVVSLDEVVQKMMSVLSSMYARMLDFLRKPAQRSHGEKILVLDDELDRMYFLGLRIIKKQLVRSRLSDSSNELRALIDAALLIKAIEHVGDSLDRSVRVLLEEPSIVETYGGELFELYRMSMKLVFDAVNAYRNCDLKHALKVTNNRREFKRRLHEFRAVTRRCDAGPGITNVIHELELIAAVVMDMVDVAISRCASVYGSAS